MKVIAIEHPHQFNADEFPPLAIALGFFDGVHKGHQTVITNAVDAAKSSGMSSGVMTFDPHPSTVLGKNVKHVRYITPIQDKIALMEKFNVEYLFIIHFTKEFASLLPQEFVDDYLINLNVRHVVAGFDYTYGRYGKGNMETLPLYSKGRFTQTIVEKQTLEEDKVSSTRIRNTLEVGNFTEFYHLAGRFYTTRGIVIHGEKRGRKLGFPTANIEVSDNYLFPATGVYAVRIYIQGSWYDGVCNVGYKPTFHEKRPEHPSVEVHMLSYNGDVYGEEAEIEWHKRLRSERKFNGLEELVKQIDADKAEAQAYFLLQR
ncbi:bifunctional riboflavin kinase/FAD synthetase [Peribacillus cavernae]|uniref:Riboflavin biosynthesis protein n=1 Tax=Peribacillus cavernae TaxID=1674310 RepID=A0A3S0VQC3_9BACI|nr:bifunctional riboflavin kinase/FAD synthetase [Peribacillus cavernae]MDQ0217032.1 riboflavin kinase/FMN adenylyltransferase [Peribacillus cavernae]RUQ30487.1 bifunctional riboflavin kinase/FAD synthetase [Peribacillus cavernae]